MVKKGSGHRADGMRAPVPDILPARFPCMLAWNLKEAKVKFTEFEKKEKFYSNNTLIYRLIHHLKMMGIKNVGNVLASMLFDRNEHTEKKKEDEESHKKLLFGNLYSK